MLKNESIAILTQLMLILNVDLTREVLNFIQKHLSSKFALFKFKHSGIIEFLIIYLDTELAPQCMELLMDIEKVVFDFNEHKLLNEDDNSLGEKTIFDYIDPLDK